MENEKENEIFNEEIIKHLINVYNLTDNNELELAIINLLNKLNICVECGNKMVAYEFKEYGKTRVIYDCPYCNRDMEKEV